MEILVFDIESTGLSTTEDRIVQFSMVCYNENLEETLVYDEFFNPGKPINKEAEAVHGISDEMVKDKPEFSTQAEFIFSKFMDPEVTICGFNIMGFDLKMLAAELKRSNLDLVLVGRNVLDVGNLSKRLLPRTLEAVYHRFHGRTIAEDVGGAHNALNDVKATFSVLVQMVNGLVTDSLEEKQFVKDGVPELEITTEDWSQQLGKYSRYDGEILDLSGKFKSIDGVNTWNFGKYMGEPVNLENQDHRGLLEWMLSKDFEPDVKKLVDSWLYPKSS
jgi:DNA polymerase-3 subunit epsilon